MKKRYLLLISISLLCSCNKDGGLPIDETITSGEKWGIRIGSAPGDVYGQLQQLGVEKNMRNVSIVYRQPFSRPEELQQLLPYYHAATLQRNTGLTVRAMFEFRGDTVNSVQVGGAHYTEVDSWPQELPAIAIKPGDTVDELYQKLVAIYREGDYEDYSIVLPDKTLDKPYDPDMGNYDEWAFSFGDHVQPMIYGSSSVRLYFRNGKLDRIRHRYNEHELVN